MIKYLYFFVFTLKTMVDPLSLFGVGGKRTKRKNSLAKLSVTSLILLPAILLGGCSSGVLDPQGPIAHHELRLLIFAILLMLIVVIPVIFLTFWFAWRYRDSATKSKYRPNWSHNTVLEIIWWAIPCVIILILGIVTWITTHSLNPYKTLESDKAPIEIEVVALDWKWMFIYPQYDIATVNKIVIPVGHPINFKITSVAPMNSFFIPQLGGQIYAMTGMITKLHLLASNPGMYRGFSANYTGEGFAHMQFYADATSEADFDKWMTKLKTAKKKLTWDYFWGHLVKRSINDSVTYYGQVDKNLFNDIVMYYMMPNYKPDIMGHMHHISEVSQQSVNK